MSYRLVLSYGTSEKRGVTALHLVLRLYHRVSAHVEPGSLAY